MGRRGKGEDSIYQRKTQADANGRTIVTSRVLAERAAALRAQTASAEPSSDSPVLWYGADLSALLRPGEQLQSNRRALFEPDEEVDAIVKKEMDTIKRIERALSAAGTDPRVRDELLWMIAGQNSLHYMAVQALLPSVDDQAGAQQPAVPAPASNGHQPQQRADAPASAAQPAPTPESKKQKKQRKESDVARFCRVVGMHRNKVYKLCRNGSIQAHHDEAGDKWYIHPDEDERFLREGPRGKTR